MTSRRMFAVLFLMTLFMMGTAFYFQYVEKLEPCPLCMLQRLCVGVVCLFSFIALLHNPKTLGLRLYGGMCLLFSGIGGAISARHIWLQSLPPDQVPGCGPGYDYIMETFPITEAIMLMLQGSGECADVVWQFLGLSIPGWTLVGFVGLGILSIVAMVLASRR